MTEEEQKVPFQQKEEATNHSVNASAPLTPEINTSFRTNLLTGLVIQKQFESRFKMNMFLFFPELKSSRESG